MAKLKKKSTEVEEAVNDLVTDVVEDYMTDDEKEVLEADGQSYIDDQTKVSSVKMNKVLEMLQEEFNLKGKNYILTGYVDKGNKIVTTLDNGEFSIQFTLNSQEMIMCLSRQ